MIPDVEVFASEARQLYERIRDMDRDNAVFEIARALLTWYGKGGTRSLEEVESRIAAQVKP